MDVQPLFMDLFTVKTWFLNDGCTIQGIKGITVIWEIMVNQVCITVWKYTIKFLQNTYGEWGIHTFEWERTHLDSQ